jgi:dTDP-glucose pyrophosphorylase
VTSPLTLVVLAAGLGSRYGGLKQLDPLGPGGATLMDYAVFDAWRSGFSRAVFVIRPEMAEAFSATMGDRYRSRLDVATALQRLDALPAGFRVPAGRSRPWGTTQAVLAAVDQIHGPFAVLNADDFYGQHSLEAVATFLRGASSRPSHHAVVGYRLEATASPAGGVNRALLERGPDGLLTRITELIGLVRTAAGDFEAPGESVARRVAADALVSMNLWAFSPAVLPALSLAFEEFLAAAPGERGECYLPDAVQRAIARREATVEVLPTVDRWCGVTYPEDRGWVAAALQRLVEGGSYPETLWP